MAEVQLALQRGPAGFEKLVVVKLVHANLAKQKTFVDMLLDEARVAALVKHPNVVDIYDLGEADGRYFIAMEYLEGEPLLGLLRAGRDGKRLDPLSTARLIADTAGGLDAAHELRSLAGEKMELVHHDVSLGNIVVLYNGQVKLVDFGVAKATQNAGPQVKIHGKFGYMAPEKLRGHGGDRRSDIWSLGVVLWEALTLRRLFRGATENETMRMVLTLDIPKPSSINHDSPPDLDAICMRALERDRDRRYATAKELARDLEEVLRLHAYGGRNDLIADYMQSTFASHIEARKRLLQEVSTKGSASADVLDAAFAEPADPAGGAMRPGRPSGEFSIQFRRPTLSDEPPHKVQEIFERRSRNSEQMLAEGTPSVIAGMRSKSTLAEATPIEEPRGRPPRARTDVPLDDIDEDSVGPLLDLAPELPAEAKAEVRASRDETLNRAISDALERFDGPVPVTPTPADPPRVMTRKLVPIPVAAKLNVHEPAVNATRVEDKKPSIVLLVAFAAVVIAVIAMLATR